MMLVYRLWPPAQPSNRGTDSHAEPHVSKVFLHRAKVVFYLLDWVLYRFVIGSIEANKAPWDIWLLLFC